MQSQWCWLVHMLATLMHKGQRLILTFWLLESVIGQYVLLVL